MLENDPQLVATSAGKLFGNTGSRPQYVNWIWTRHAISSIFPGFHTPGGSAISQSKAKLENGLQLVAISEGKLFGNTGPRPPYVNWLWTRNNITSIFSGFHIPYTKRVARQAKVHVLSYPFQIAKKLKDVFRRPRASYQIRTNVVCECAGNAGNADKRSQHASRHVRHACAVMHAGIAN